MRLTLFLARVLTGVAAFLGTVAGEAPASPTPVEFWHVGDDGLSERLADSVDNAFTQSSEFRLRNGQEPRALIVTVPTNVHWKLIRTRTQVRYTVEFSSTDGRNLGVGKGSCWEDEIMKCAAQILRDAKTAARKVH